MINAIGECFMSSQKQKRFRCYRDAVARKWEVLGYQQRMHTGWCFENTVGVAFPDESFTDYRAVTRNIATDFNSEFYLHQ